MLNRPSPPADDLTPGRRSTRALQAIRRPEAVRDTCLPSIDDPSGRPNRQTVQTSSTILEHTTRLQLPADELPPLVHTGPLLNHVQRIAEMKRLSAPTPAWLRHHRSATALVEAACSSASNIPSSRHFWARESLSTCSVYILACCGVRASRHALVIPRRAQVISRFACCGVRAFSRVMHRRRHGSR